MVRQLAADPTRILQYSVPADRYRAMASDLLIRAVVKSNVIRKDANNRSIKPCSQQGPFFNVSHDEDFVILGSHLQASVGVDLMKVQISCGNKSINEMFSNLHAIFTPSEWAFIRDPQFDPLSRFYFLWTAKEAYVKCIGTGLYTEPHDLETFGWKQKQERICMQIRQVGFPNACDFKIVVFTKSIPDYIFALCSGPVSACDASWVSLIEPQSTLDDPPDASWMENVELVQFHLSELLDP